MVEQGGVKGQIEGEIKNNKVMIYSKSYCPHCKATKNTLTEQNISFKAVELD